MRINHLTIGVICILFIEVTNGFQKSSLAILMPNVQPAMNETYLCKGIRIDPTEKLYIVGFTPNATMRVAHHILLYGCTLPGSRDRVWDCGDMTTGHGHHGHGLRSSNPCSSGSQVIYAWARDAPPLDLPEGVAFQIGLGTEILYLTVQVHYADVSTFQNGRSDDSGIILHYTKTPQPRAAGIILLGTTGLIPPEATEHMETACTIDEDNEIHPFAFRTHTHKLGRVVSGYHVRRDTRGVDQWTLTGKGNPQKPQMFYPVTNEVIVKKGDVLAARCTMVNDGKTITVIGSTSHHEMCNYYLMYWVNGSTPLEQKACFTEGPPSYYWHKGHSKDLVLNNIPSDSEASFI